jgi:3-hydroxymyristoyl/3-hydroxydecanoyl-(acyl carrier protein) dehydratase
MFDRDIIFTITGAQAKKYVSGSEPFALGHYAGDPIFPGVLSLELMLGLCERFIDHRHQRSPSSLRIRRMQLLDLVRPGDDLTVAVEIKDQSEDAVVLRASITVDDVEKSRATFECALA